MLLYRTASGWWIETAPGMGIAIPAANSLTTREDLFEYLEKVSREGVAKPLPKEFLAPLEEQEVWAAGVTYFRSRAARMADSSRGGICLIISSSCIMDNLLASN